MLSNQSFIGPCAVARQSMDATMLLKSFLSNLICYPSMLSCAQGLILLNATSCQTSILANRVSPTSPKNPGAELIFSDDLDVASDGTVYFSTMTDIPLAKGPTGQYDAMSPCVLNIMQVSSLHCFQASKAGR